MAAPLVLVGCGNMGFALLQGWISARAISPGDVLVVEPAPQLAERARATGVHVVSAAEELTLAIEPRLVVLAVKPQLMMDVAPGYARFRDCATYVSLAAGISTARLGELLGEVPILRIMPNMPVSIGKGSTVAFANERVTSSVREEVRGLLSTGGAVHFIDQEDFFDAVTALSGSGPAYVFLFMECLARRAAALGLPEELALDLARETVSGAAALAMADTHIPLDRLRDMVTSPNGTTAAGLSALLTAGRFERLIDEAMVAARNRSISISSEY